MGSLDCRLGSSPSSLCSPLSLSHMLTYAAYADVCCGMRYQIAGLASSHRVYALDLLGFGFRYSVCFLYWYKSTNTDTEGSDKPNITYCNTLWGHQLGDFIREVYYSKYICLCMVYYSISIWRYGDMYYISICTYVYVHVCV